MAHTPIAWRGSFNQVVVRIRQRLGLGRHWVDVRATGAWVTVEGKQFTDASRSHTPTQRTRRLGLAGLVAVWERQRLETYSPDMPEPAAWATLTLRRPGKPDVYLPFLDASDEDLDELCDALSGAADAASMLAGHGRAEVPMALRSLIRDKE